MVVAFVFLAIVSGLAGAVVVGVMTGSFLLALLAYVGFGTVGMFAGIALAVVRSPRDWEPAPQMNREDMPRFDIAAE